jgi:lipid-binding SYLF domain-containing protein
MKLVLKFSCVLAAFALVTPLLQATEQERVDQAASIIQRFKALPENSIPAAVLNEARGLAILTVVKAGFIWSGKFGDGVVVARLGKGWSGPAFIRTAGAGFGAQIGGQVTEFVLVLNTPDAVKAFSEGTNVQLGGALSVAAGPVGRAAEAGVTTRAAVYSYSISQGLFAGVSLEGTVIEMNRKANARYYAPASPVTPRLILSGQIPPPPGAGVLLRCLEWR